MKSVFVAVTPCNSLIRDANGNVCYYPSKHDAEAMLREQSPDVIIISVEQRQVEMDTPALQS